MNCVVLDTNVIVSALLNPYGSPGRVWDLVTARHLRLAYDDRVLMEYAVVLHRGKFGFSPQRVEAVLEVFPFQEFCPAAPWPYAHPPDPDDVMFCEVALAANCPFVTGNTRHFPESIRRHIRIFTPSEWLKFLLEDPR